MSAPSSLPFSRPFIGEEEEAAVLRVLRSGWLTTASEALAFETEFAAYLNQNSGQTIQALAVNSATSGLHLALEACGVGPGDIIITTPYTFTASAEIARYLGAEVVFADIAADSFMLDPIQVESVLKRLSAGLPAYPAREAGDGFGPRGQVKAIIPVHFGGLACPMSQLCSLAASYDCKIVEDAAHAFPSPIDEAGIKGYAGTVGDLGVFSFYATKTITTGEGGMVTTADPELAAKIALMRCHGIDRAVWNRYTDRQADWRYAVVAAGYKYNLPDLLAAIGRQQLKRADELRRQRRLIAQSYNEAFAADERFLTPPTGPSDACHLYVLRLAKTLTQATKGSQVRDQLIERLKAAGIGVSVHYIPLHIMPYYRQRYGFIDTDFPEAIERFCSALSLPIWPGMTDDQVQSVVKAVRENTDGLTG